jgi:hypothetical protein
MDFGAGVGGGRGQKNRKRGVMRREEDDRGGRAAADGRVVVMRWNRIRACGSGGLSGSGGGGIMV